jgi:hypothetical protein
VHPFSGPQKWGYQIRYHVEDAEKFVRLRRTSQSEQNQHRQEKNSSIFGGENFFPTKNAQNIFFIQSESTVFSRNQFGWGWGVIFREETNCEDPVPPPL